MQKPEAKRESHINAVKKPAARVPKKYPFPKVVEDVVAYHSDEPKTVCD